MATIILDYNAKNAFAQKTLEYILSLGLFQHQTAEYTSGIEAKSVKRKKIDKIFDNYLVDLSNFKFNRDEANDYE